MTTTPRLAVLAALARTDLQSAQQLGRSCGASALRELRALEREGWVRRIQRPASGPTAADRVAARTLWSLTDKARDHMQREAEAAHRVAVADAQLRAAFAAHCGRKPNAPGAPGAPSAPGPATPGLAARITTPTQRPGALAPPARSGATDFARHPSKVGQALCFRPDAPADAILERTA